MATVIVVDNKIRVTPGVGETGIIVTIVKKEFDELGNIEDIAISTSSPLTTVYDSAELEDGVYQVDLSAYLPVTSIVFVISKIEEQRALFEVDCIKTLDFVGQKDTRVYYDLIAFCIQYDRLIAAITLFNTTPIIPFVDSGLVNYFDTIINYFKYEITE
jgi:hypothetical protein